jgi:hypothetical protein
VVWWSTPKFGNVLSVPDFANVCDSIRIRGENHLSAVAPLRNMMRQVENDHARQPGHAHKVADGDGARFACLEWLDLHLCFPVWEEIIGVRPVCPQVHSSCSAFNKFAHGNRRLPRSTLSGVKCLPSPRCRRQRAFHFHRYRTVTPLPRPEPHPSPCRNRHTPGQESAADSGGDRAAKPTPIRTRIGGSSPPDSGTDRHPADGKAAPHPGAANTSTARLKEKTPRTPGNPSAYPDPHTLPDRSPWPPRNASGSYSARKSDSYFSTSETRTPAASRRRQIQPLYRAMSGSRLSGKRSRCFRPTSA